MQDRHSHSEKTLRDLFYKEWSKSKALKGDIEHYDRLSHDHEDRSMKYMRDCIERYLRKKRTKANREAQERDLKNHGKKDPPAAPAQPKGKAKAKGKARPPSEDKRTGRPKEKGKGGGGKGGDRDRSSGRDREPSKDRVERKKKPYKDLVPKDFCFFFNSPDGCKLSDEKCKFVHKKCPESMKDKLVKPSSRSRSASREKKKKTVYPKFCNEFKRTGKCKYGDNCKSPHLTEEQYRAALLELNPHFTKRD